MDICEFFEQSVGKWFSQRTTHDLVSNQSASGQSSLWVEVIAANDATVQQLCQHHQIDPDQALLGVKIRWEGDMGLGTKKQVGSALLVPLLSPDQNRTGKLIQQAITPAASMMVSHYALDEEDALTLITHQDGYSLEERVWFASPTLRFRTSTMKRSDEFTSASFCSEIRLGDVAAA
jgi:hypothetical protein